MLYTDDIVIFLSDNFHETQLYNKFWINIAYSLANLSTSKNQKISFIKHFSSTQKTIMFTLHIFENSNPILYMGHTLPIGKKKKCGFQGLLNKLKFQLDSWKAKLLSQEGRTNLIKLVQHNIQIYSISTFKLLIWICQSTDSIVRKFLWIKNIIRNSYLFLVYWNKICLPKNYGGIGEYFNRTILAKAAS